MFQRCDLPFLFLPNFTTFAHPGSDCSRNAARSSSVRPSANMYTGENRMLQRSLLGGTYESQYPTVPLFFSSQLFMRLVLLSWYKLNSANGIPAVRNINNDDLAS